MEYKKITRKNITLHYINTDRFKNISVVLFLTKKFDKNDIPYGNLLVNNLVYSSKKYNTKNKMSTMTEELFGTRVSSSFGITGACESFVFSLDFLNPVYTEQKYLDESLDFLSEILFNPNIENGGFKEEYFNILKQDLISSIESIKDNPNAYASMRYVQTMYAKTPSSYTTLPKLSDLKNVTRESLYDFYKTLFNGSYNFDIVILGDTNEDIIDKVFKIFDNIKSNNKKLSFYIKHKYDTKIITKIDTLPFNQSKLYVGYRLNNLTYHELNHVLRVYNTILGTMNDSILFNVIRESNSLCYSVGSYYSKYNPSLTVYAGINKENYEKTIELIKQCVDSMSDKKVVERLFDSAKKTINTYLNNYYDDVTMQINHYYNSSYEIKEEDVEEVRECVNNVTIEEVLELNKKITLSTIYMLKGDNN